MCVCVWDGVGMGGWGWGVDPIDVSLEISPMLSNHFCSPKLTQPSKSPPPPPTHPHADPTSPEYDVFFIDFGNADHVRAAATRTITPDLSAVPPQAHPASLAFLKVSP